MGQEIKYLYTIEDLNKAFDMGFENAVFTLEKAIDLSHDGQKYLLECMKEKIMESRIAPAKANRSIIPII